MECVEPLEIYKYIFNKNYHKYDLLLFDIKPSRILFIFKTFKIPQNAHDLQNQLKRKEIKAILYFPNDRGTIKQF